MEAEAVTELPSGHGWQYEPKYDGFRCLMHMSDRGAQMMSKNQKPLQRFFPELVKALQEQIPNGYVADGEIISPAGFEALQLRLHPAESRIVKLSAESPCRLVLFDLLAEPDALLLQEPLLQRRQRLEGLARLLPARSPIRIGKATVNLRTARSWVGRNGTDGVMAKKLSQPYTPGRRCMKKFKLWTTYDCVVGGIGYAGGKAEHILLGLYDGMGRLHYVGRARLGKDGTETDELLSPFEGGLGFTGRSPGIENRWSGTRMRTKILVPRFVAEVSTDHVTDNYMRHGARLVRWRPDKNPEACTIEQFSGK